MCLLVSSGRVHYSIRSFCPIDSVDVWRTGGLRWWFHHSFDRWRYRCVQHQYDKTSDSSVCSSCFCQFDRLDSFFACRIDAARSFPLRDPSRSTSAEHVSWHQAMSFRSSSGLSLVVHRFCSMPVGCEASEDDAWRINRDHRTVRCNSLRRASVFQEFDRSVQLERRNEEKQTTDANWSVDGDSLLQTGISLRFDRSTWNSSTGELSLVMLVNAEHLECFFPKSLFCLFVR